VCSAITAGSFPVVQDRFGNGYRHHRVADRGEQLLADPVPAAADQGQGEGPAGFEAVGEVAAVGEGVAGLEPGARVIGTNVVRQGAFAEYMVLPAAAAVPVPAGWADEQALGMVVNWPTALAALKPLGGIGAGQTVLIHAAAGGTGQAAVKMAKHYGATVIAAASPGKHETVRALGADHVLDSSAPIPPPRCFG
jgi:NADPH:quinone reductase-like Zn-dependent oxidoreductase